MTDTTFHRSGYTFDNAWRQARDRLALLETVLDPGSIRRLEALGVGAGWHCLEVGAGGGSTTEWLCQRVGPTGRVMTADFDAGALARIPEGPFDVIHARSLLGPFPGQGEVVAALAGRLWPGGLMLVEERDPTTLLSAASGAYRTVWEHLRRLEEPGEPAHLLPSVLRSAGLAAVGAESTTPWFAGGSPDAQFSQLTWRAEETRLLADGLPASALAEAHAELDDPARWFPNLGMVAAWGRRPTVVVSY
jgi:hypothetical protein